MAFKLKRGDRRPHYRVTLQQTGVDGVTMSPVDLTAATAVKFFMKPTAGGSLKVNSTGSFVDRTNGVVEYAWAALDTDTSATYNMEVEVDWGGEKQTFPSEGFFEVVITDDLA